MHANGEAAALLLARAAAVGPRAPTPRRSPARDHVELLRAAAWTTGREHEPARAESLPARRAGRARRQRSRCAPPTCSSTSRASSSTRAARPRPRRRAGAALALLPDGPSAARAMLLAERRQGADARIALRRGGRGGRGGARGRPRGRRRASPSCGRWTAWASRCSGSAATRRASARCARRSSGSQRAAAASTRPARARQPRRRAGRRRPPGRGARGRRRGRRARRATRARRGAG